MPAPSTAVDPRLVRDIAWGSPFTSTPGEWLARLYRLPRQLKGMRALDLCAGSSGFADWLASRGASAVALDFHYGTLDRFRARWRAWLEASARERLGQASLPTEVDAVIEEALATFEEQRRAGAHTLVAGSAHALPFANGSFDLVTSFAGLFGSIDADELLLRAALSEAPRVLRRGGRLQLAPALVGNWLSATQAANQRRLVDTLKGDRRYKVTFVVHNDADAGRFGRLVVEKR